MKEFFKTTTGVLVGLVAVFALFTAIAIGGAHFDNWFSSKTAEPRGQRAMRENTQANGAFRQAAYEEFFSLCSQAQTTQEQIANLEDEKKSANADRADRLATSITALKMSLSENVNDYNTKANEFHRSQFLDAKLPYPLSIQETIKCV